MGIKAAALRILFKLAHTGTQNAPTNELRKTILLSNTLILIYTTCMFGLAIVFFFTGLSTLFQISVFWTLLTFSLLHFNKTGWNLTASLSVMILSDLYGMICCWLLGKETHFHTGFFCVVGAPLVLFGNNKRLVFFGVALSLACYFGNQWMPDSLAYSGVVSPTAQTWIRNGIDFIVFGVTFGTFYYFFTSNRENENHLKEINRALDSNLSELKDTQALLVQSGKMAALGEMSAGMAHEINTPLAVIHMTAEQMSEQLNETTLNRELLKKMCEDQVHTTLRIAKIISGLRAFCRNDGTDELTLESIDGILEEATLLCSQRFKNQNIDLRLPKTPTGIQVKCISTQVFQVLLNLINNSRDAIQDLPTRWVEVTVNRRDQKIEIAVTDSGPGIEANVRQKIFQPFFTTKEIGKGVGIGLSLSRALIERQHGTLFLDESCANTRFVISLPSPGK